MTSLLCTGAFLNDLETKTVSYINLSQLEDNRGFEYIHNRFMARCHKLLKKGFEIDVDKIENYFTEKMGEKILPGKYIKNDRGWIDKLGSEAHRYSRMDWFDYSYLLELTESKWVKIEELFQDN